MNNKTKMIICYLKNIKTYNIVYPNDPFKVNLVLQIKPWNVIQATRRKKAQGSMGTLRINKLR